MTNPAARRNCVLLSINADEVVAEAVGRPSRTPVIDGTVCYLPFLWV